MSSTDPTTATDHREFRARFPWRLMAVTWLCLGLACGLRVATWLLTRAIDPAIWPASTWRFALVVSVTPLLVLLCTYVIALEARRASVLLDDDGLTVTDWRRRQQRLLWDDVLWLRTARWAGRSGGVMRVGTSAGSVRFAYPIERPEALRQAIIAGAGLTESKKGWMWLVYRRAARVPGTAE